jgi:endonuclease/exonuclease/phosphatase family metal-dependent hydrolase
MIWGGKKKLGDFNVKVGKGPYLYPTCGGHSSHSKTNDNGKRMVNFALGRDLDATETWYQHNDIHKVTWTSPDNKVRNQINYILVKRRHCTSVCGVASMRGAETESDHLGMWAKIRLKIKRSAKNKRSDNKDVGYW